QQGEAGLRDPFHGVFSGCTENGRSPSVAMRTDCCCPARPSTTSCGAMMGSGPSVSVAWLPMMVLALTTSTPAPSQCSGSDCAVAPSNTKPSRVVCQTIGTPVARDCARPASSSAASRCPSRWSCVCDESRKAKPTPAEAMAMIATTTSNSSRVKPFWLLPTADFRILPLAYRLAAGSERHDINLALDAGVEI